MEKPPIYLSFDIEADGTNPFQNSMLSIGIAAFTDENGLVDQFYSTIFPQRDGYGQPFLPNKKTLQDFWKPIPEQWKLVHTNQKSPEIAMANLAKWLTPFTEQYSLKWVARPANCDWMWLKCYYEQYGPLEKPDIGYYCHDLSSLMRAYCLINHIADKKKFMLALSGNVAYTHNSLDDATAQGFMYINLRRLLKKTCFQSIEYVPNGLKIVTQTYDLHMFVPRDKPEIDNEEETARLK